MRPEIEGDFSIARIRNLSRFIAPYPEKLRNLLSEQSNKTPWFLGLIEGSKRKGSSDLSLLTPSPDYSIVLKSIFLKVGSRWFTFPKAT